MTKYIFLFIAIGTFLFQSCNEDSFSQIVEIDIPVHDPKPALKLLMAAGQDAPQVLVSNSKGVIDPDSIYKVPANAEVKLYKNGELIKQLMYNDETLMYTDTLDEPISDTVGDEYMLEAKLEGYNLVTATQIMPPKPIVTNATYEAEGTIDPEGWRVDEIVVDLVDADPNKVNYFGLKLFQLSYYINISGDTVHLKNDLSLNSNDPLLSYSSNYSLIFTDEAFSGGAFQLRAYTYSTIQEETELEVEVFQLTRDAFFFERSFVQYIDAIDNPFAEPVTVHNNIEGGYGIFSLANSTVFKIIE